MTTDSELAANVREILELARNGNSLTQKPEAALDPTKNVLDKVVDAVKRLDDISELRARYEEKLALKETERINAVNQAERERINAVIADIRNSVLIASKEAATTAGTLATQVATTAEALRSRTETKGQSNFNFSQIISIGGIAVLVVLDLHSRGII